MSEEMVTIKQQVETTEEALLLFGNNDSHLKVIEQELQVSIVTRGQEVRVNGTEEAITLVEEILKHLLLIVRKGIAIGERDIAYAIHLAKRGQLDHLEQLFEEEVFRNAKGRAIRVKTLGQRHYIQGIKRNDLVFGIGPAGTGKTYLAVVMAVRALKKGEVKRIILTRPAVEAGESLGFLPGDLKEKVDPYLRPLYDALHDVLGQEQTTRMIERGVIEIAPLAYMRGRTLDDCFVILDEAQNTTNAQMKMFLTRLGFGSKMVITGDPSQIDLPKGVKSGLHTIYSILQNVKGISFVQLEQTDVVRHPLVRSIIEAYDRIDKNSDE